MRLAMIALLSGLLAVNVSLGRPRPDTTPSPIEPDNLISVKKELVEEVNDRVQDDFHAAVYGQSYLLLADAIRRDTGVLSTKKDFQVLVDRTTKSMGREVGGKNTGVNKVLSPLFDVFKEASPEWNSDTRDIGVRALEIIGSALWEASKI